jgi:TRAP-type C4-dicarboxylate transport system substrate-binding protein
MKKLMAIVLMIVLVLGTVGCGATEESSDAGGIQKRTWKLGHVRPTETSTDEDAIRFKDAIAEASDGQITVEIYPSSQLGDYSVVQERIGMGDIEMQLAPAGTSVDKALGIASIPYLTGSWDEAEQVYSMDSKLMQAVAERFDEQGIKLLAPYPKYFGGIVLATEPVSPGDPNVDKGIKIRVPGIKSFEENAKSLGYIATPIAFSEAFTSIQTGIVDGAIGSGAEGYYSSFRDVIDYYLPVKSHFEMWFLYMSKDVYDDLSDEEKALVEDAASELAAGRWERAEVEEQEYLKLLDESGVEVVEITDDQVAEMAAKARTEVWPKIKGDYGEELFDEIIQSLGY